MFPRFHRVRGWVKNVDFASKSALYYDSIASRYDDHLAEDAWTRSSFHDLVLQHVSVGSLVLDFGCGTGTDSLWYAQQGLRVLACDISVGMIGELEKKCRSEIANGTIMPLQGEYETLLKLPLREKPSAVLCNFAVLSLIPDLGPAFEAFADYLASGGLVIINSLNPLFWRELASPWYWKYLIRSLGKGAVQTPGAECDTCRYFVRTMDDVAAPRFTRILQASVDAVLSRAQSRAQWREPTTFAHRMEKQLWKVPLLRGLGRYVFLVYRRC